jgi:cytochrome c553
MLKELVSAAFGSVVLVAAGSASAQQPADDISARVQTCGACHGQNGVPLDPKTMPPIWGQQVYYIVKQLHDYRSGDRDSPIMAGIAKAFPQREDRKIAEYFAAKTWPANPSPAPASEPPAGMAQCQACHQPKFEGGPPAPRLAGLSYEYLVASMKAFADGRRTNNGDMPQIMRALSDSQREAMAKYLAGL